MPDKKMKIRDRETRESMKKVYAEFGIDFMELEPYELSKFNALAEEIVKLRKKLTTKV